MQRASARGSIEIGDFFPDMPRWLLAVVLVAILLVSIVVPNLHTIRQVLFSVQVQVPLTEQRQVAQPFNTTQGKQAQPAPEVADPVALATAEWPRIAPEWEYTRVIPPMPKGEGIYDGRARDAFWGTGRGTPEHEEGRAIAKRIVPSITDRDGVGLSIVQNPDNPLVFLGAVYIIRDVQSRAELVIRGEFQKEAELGAKGVHEIHLGVSVDNQDSWTILELPLGGANNVVDDGIDVIDHVIITGISSLNINIRPFNSFGYWKTDILP